MEFLKKHPKKWWSSRELAEEFGIRRNTAAGNVTALLKFGLVECDHRHLSRLVRYKKRENGKD